MNRHKLGTRSLIELSTLIAVVGTIKLASAIKGVDIFNSPFGFGLGLMALGITVLAFALPVKTI